VRRNEKKNEKKPQVVSKDSQNEQVKKLKALTKDSSTKELPHIISLIVTSDIESGK
jgi:hypothetical protein